MMEDISQIFPDYIKDNMFLGAGSYGQVRVRDNQAVKKFSKLSHLVQEYMALQYLSECNYVVSPTGVDFENLELQMELYDGSLRKWLGDQYKHNDGPNTSDVMIIIHDILHGLIELHDRNLAHGDLKPGNILIRNEPLGAVLGDCGFVSIAKYAKVERTAPNYRDPVIGHDQSHDMFSLGICLLEIIGNIKINRQAKYRELQDATRKKIQDKNFQKIIYNLLHPDRDRRPTARVLLYRLFHQSPDRWMPVIPSGLVSTENKDLKYIRRLMKDSAHRYGINRGKKGYGAVLSYIELHHIPASQHRLYTGITLMILSAVFGKSGYRADKVLKLCNHRYKIEQVYAALDNALKDINFISVLLAP